MTTTLEAITTNFRRFTKNQVLTEGHLNQIVDYFDDQIRLSRTGLSGVGVVCGFEVSCNETTSEITITQGVGVTTDGDLFNLYQEGEEDSLNIDFESMIYKGYREYDNSQAQYTPFFYNANGDQITIYELLPEAPEIPKAPKKKDRGPIGNIPGNLKDMVVLLYLETFVEETDLCSTLGCDNQGENRVANHKVLLVSKADADIIKTKDQSIQKTNYGALYYKLPEVIMNKVVAAPRIFDTYNDLKQSFYQAILQDGTVDTLKDGYAILLDAMITPGFNDLKNIVKNRFEQLFDFNEFNVPDDFQYRYDLLKDLVDTYNEIKELLLGIDVSDCFAQYEDFPKHLMIGEVDKQGQCYEYRHGFYKSPILADYAINTCSSCAPVELDYDISSGDGDLPCEEGNPQGNHIVFVIDESGSYSQQRELVRGALRGYLTSVSDTNTFVSFVGMSRSFTFERGDHVIHKPANDQSLFTWLDNYTTSASEGTSSSDYWGPGFKAVIELVLNVETVPDPAIVIVIADEESGVGFGQNPAPTINLLNAIKGRTKFFAYLIDNNPKNQIFSGNAATIIPNAVPSLDGESDLDRSDYFLTDTFVDLEVKIKNLNESLINSNIFCPETTEDEVVVDQNNIELEICYSSDQSEQRLFGLVKRTVQQLTNYNPEYSFIKITPSLNLGNLSKKAIPFYYNVGEKMIEYWDFDKTTMGTHRTNISYHDELLAIKRPLEFCLDNDFYRVEGHLGRNYIEVVDRINSIKKSNSLGFNVVALPIESFDVVGQDYKTYYLNKNYGLEHKAGVPPGGTLVLFYLDGNIGDGGSTVAMREEESSMNRAVAVADTADSLGTSFKIDSREQNPIVADFCLPYLCCEENEVDACLPEEIVCYDENTEPIPFEVTPRTATVRANVRRELDGGVVRNFDGTYSFDPKRVSPELYGLRITFLVNNQRSKFGVRIFEKAKIAVSITCRYTNNRTAALVTFTVTGTDVNRIEKYYWNFGDGSAISNVRPNSSGKVEKTYTLPVNSENTVYPTLSVTKGLCETDVLLDEIKFDDKPYYYYGGVPRRRSVNGDDSILSISIGDL